MAAPQHPLITTDANGHTHIAFGDNVGNFSFGTTPTSSTYNVTTKTLGSFGPKDVPSWFSPISAPAQASEVAALHIKIDKLLKEVEEIKQKIIDSRV